MKFNSQICTSKSQSEALLKLGLKKETADMGFRELGNGWREYFVNGDVYNLSPSKIFPAWSLHRLLTLLPKYFDVEIHSISGRSYRISIELDITCELDIVYRDHYGDEFKGFYGSDIYHSVVLCIEWLIKEGYFNKEYLENGTTENKEM